MPEEEKYIDAKLKRAFKKYAFLILSALQLLATLPFGVSVNRVCWQNCFWRTPDPIGDIVSSVDYYDILRIVTVLVVLYFIYSLKNRLNNIRYFGLFTAVVLFNPFFVPILERGAWVILDLAFSIYFFYLFNFLKGHTEQEV